jgi:hypothetical protein
MEESGAVAKPNSNNEGLILRLRYTNGPALTPQHVAIQEIMSANETMDNETPLFLLLNTAPGEYDSYEHR